MSGAEAGGVGKVETLEMTKSSTGSGDFTAESADVSQGYVGFIAHDPSAYSGATSCSYVISVYNPSVLSTRRQVSFLGEIRLEQMQDVNLFESYIN